MNNKVAMSPSVYGFFFNKRSNTNFQEKILTFAEMKFPLNNVS